jgi:tRNA A37 threonylcarbamoyltransferase TsaD
MKESLFVLTEDIYPSRLHIVLVAVAVLITNQPQMHDVMRSSATWAVGFAAVLALCFVGVNHAATAVLREGRRLLPWFLYTAI